MLAIPLNPTLPLLMTLLLPQLDRTRDSNGTNKFQTTTTNVVGDHCFPLPTNDAYAKTVQVSLSFSLFFSPCGYSSTSLHAVSSSQFALQITFNQSEAQRHFDMIPSDHRLTPFVPVLPVAEKVPFMAAIAHFVDTSVEPNVARSACLGQGAYNSPSKEQWIHFHALLYTNLVRKNNELASANNLVVVDDERRSNNGGPVAGPAPTTPSPSTSPSPSPFGSPPPLPFTTTLRSTEVFVGG